MRSIFFGILLFVMFGLMFSTQTLYNYHQDNNITFDIYNFTSNNLVWNYTSSGDMIRNNISEMNNLDYSKIQSKRIANIIYKFIDFFGYCMFEVSKLFIEFGYTHPEYNFGYFMQFVKYWLYAMIIFAIFPIIIPLFALIYLLYVKIKNIMEIRRMR